VEFYRSEKPSLIAVIDPITADVKPVGEGRDPAPDGKQLLLNEMKGDLRYIDIDVVLLDIQTSRTTTKLVSSLPVFGWVPRRK
jgi:hypothetical protein